MLIKSQLETGNFEIFCREINERTLICAIEQEYPKKRIKQLTKVSTVDT